MLAIVQPATLVAYESTAAGAVEKLLLRLRRLAQLDTGASESLVSANVLHINSRARSLVDAGLRPWDIGLAYVVLRLSFFFGKDHRIAQVCRVALLAFRPPHDIVAAVCSAVLQVVEIAHGFGASCLRFSLTSSS